MLTRYHLVLNRTTWFLVAEDPEKVVGKFATRREAVDFSVSHLQRHGGDLVIHGEKGRPAEHFTSYGRRLDA
ncbi:MAG TPA: DUF2188 domain-containing protein [Nevskiaceae bacterium]|nr:DUF2188 domain-containing protein [Nevskiaceae bacterium]